MKIWIDCEFIEDGITIDLISIGMEAEDDRTLYYVNRECDFSKASDWVLENVLLPMGLDRSGFSKNPGDPDASPVYRQTCLASRDRKEIAQLVKEFVYAGNPPSSSIDKPQFWGDYPAYDWLCICQLFGEMMDLPRGFPMRCNDIQQWREMLGNPELPKQTEGMHNALGDARWTRTAWEFLRDYQAKK